MFGEQRMWLWPHAAPVSTLISIMIGGTESVIGPSTQRAQRAVSLDDGKWTSNYRSWHKALGRAETQCPSHYKAKKKKSLLNQLGTDPKASSFICRLTVKVSLIERQVINLYSLKITTLCSAGKCGIHALPRIITEACNAHATCDMGQRFQRTWAHISMSLAGREDGSHAIAENEQVSWNAWLIITHSKKSLLTWSKSQKVSANASKHIFWHHVVQIALLHLLACHQENEKSI